MNGLTGLTQQFAEWLLLFITILGCSTYLRADQRWMYRSIARRACVERASRFYQHGHLNSAIFQLRQALRLAGPDADVYFMLGNALYRSQDFWNAAEVYKAAVRLQPNHFEGHMSLGFALFESGL